MTVKVLVKVRGKRKNRAVIHLYDAENGCALCRSWPRPGGAWEVQEIESFPSGAACCWHCKAKQLRAAGLPSPPKKPRKPTRRQRELEAWERWTALPYKIWNSASK